MESNWELDGKPEKERSGRSVKYVFLITWFLVVWHEWADVEDGGIHFRGHSSCCGSAAVILFSSRSVTLTIFSTVTIAYVLTSVTATLVVALGWTLGFLEQSICFAILIGVSVDFVIHFSHAYSAMGGEASRGDQTRYALIRMGPSILAAAFTTIAAAVIMLFTT